MGLKQPGVYYQKSHDNKHKIAALIGIEALMKYRGMVYGMWSGDEHLSGNNPIQGTELCAVVEYMFTLEIFISIFGDVVYGDMLEKVTYNVLPATTKPDFWAHQYDQQANQIMCTVAKRNWYNNGDDANIYGLEPNFGCCTANMHQGWPKFASSLWMATVDGGLAAIVYAPCEVQAKVADDKKVTIIQDTDYPFDGVINIHIKCEDAIQFPLKFRIPKWANKASIKINDREEQDILPGTFHTIHRSWKNGDRIEIDFPMSIQLSKWYNNSVGVEMGAIVYGLKIKERWDKIKGTEPYADWGVLSKSPWNYSLIIDDKSVDNNFEIVKGQLEDLPYNPETSPIKVMAKGKRVRDWTIEDSSAGELPESPIEDCGDFEDITLVPYGCTNIRIAQFPIAKEPF